MNFKQFKELYDQNLNNVANECKAFPWDNKYAYSTWLANTHYYAKETPRMLSLSASVMPEKNRAVCYRFIRHACEEMGHEKQIERDLKFLGYKLNDLPITNEMKMCHRSLSYWGQLSENAIGFMGWVVLVEGLAVEAGEHVYNQIIKHYSPKAANFLKSHSDEDPDHINKAFMVLKQLDVVDLEVIADSINMYSHQYISFLNSAKSKIQAISKEAS